MDKPGYTPGPWHVVPYGDGNALVNDTGRVIGQLAILNLPAGTDYRAGSQQIAQQIINALRGTS